mmetsp:Transcript_47620/g.101943  ORF Transcript_47620/g.101943 Transcript_47620/m.101943 type:complete len:95 (+) Transcript_47620:545-829(+)
MLTSSEVGSKKRGDRGECDLASSVNEERTLFILDCRYFALSESKEAAERLRFSSDIKEGAWEARVVNLQPRSRWLLPLPLLTVSCILADLRGPA